MFIARTGFLPLRKAIQNNVFIAINGILAYDVHNNVCIAIAGILAYDLHNNVFIATAGILALTYRVYCHSWHPNINVCYTTY